MLNTDAFEVTYKSKKTNTNDPLDVRDDIEAGGAPMGIFAGIAMGLLILALIVLIAVFYRLRKRKMLH